MNMKKNIGALVLAAALSAGAMGTAQAYDPGKIFFECNYWSDTHGDNQIYYPEGYVNIKNNFKDNESIICVGHDPNWYTGEDVEWVVYNSNNQPVVWEEKIIPCNGDYRHAGESDGRLMNKIMNSSIGGDGTYRVVWFERASGQDNFQEDGESYFTISPSN